MKRSLYPALLACFVGTGAAYGQTSLGDNLDSYLKDYLNPVTTAVPFLTISPDARAGGMGDVGVATTPDANAMHWNIGKLAFLDEKYNGLSLSYTPWLSRLVPDINLAYMSYAFKLNERQAVGMSLRYFSLGDINFTNEDGVAQGTFSPNEFAIDGGYSLKLGEQFSLGVALRYIYSNLTQGQVVAGLQTKAGQSFASDVGFYYKGREFNLERGTKADWSAGLAVTNVGGKIAYTESGQADFIPANLRLGGTFSFLFDQYNKITLIGEASKLLVPTPPVRDTDGNIIAGKDDDVGFFSGIFQSFNDAPGGFNEEIKEVIWQAGAEYWYDDKFAFRGGYHHEHQNKGNRKYFTVGVGLKYNVFGLDFAYLIPANATVRSPLENTLRFTLFFDFGGSDSES